MQNAYQKYPLLVQLADAGIIGRGGAGFPTHLKWLRLKDYHTPTGYVVCNASEGEMNVHKDAYILEHFPEMVVKGMVVAMQFLGVKTAYININKEYFEKYRTWLREYTDRASKEHNLLFHFYIEEPSYIGGESSALLNAIEGKRTQPRLSPPSPSLVGIHGKPTLVNNVETFYDVARVVDGTFTPTRFVTIVGPIPNPGVFEIHRDRTVTQTLEETGNLPAFPYFVQVGGSASGIVITSEQAKEQVLMGCGAIEIYGTDAKPYDVLTRWFEFYANESCGKCTPCREGTALLYKRMQALKPNEPIPWNEILTVNTVLKTTTLCDLGKSLPIPVESYMKNILKMEVAL